METSKYILLTEQTQNDGFPMDSQIGDEGKVSQHHDAHTIYRYNI